MSLFLACVLRVSLGSVLCEDVNQGGLDKLKAECAESSGDPLTTCNIVATKDKKRWFFIYSSL